MNISVNFSRLTIICLVVAAACSKDNDPTENTDPPAAPLVMPGTDITTTGFKANWNAVTSATGYQLDVSADEFATFVAGYSSKSVSGTSEVISGLTPNTTYHYRVRATNANGTSANSTPAPVFTLEEEEEENESGVAMIDGEAFNPDEIALTDTNIGLELYMTQGDDDITIRLSDKVSGTYTVQNTVPTGRTAAETTAIISWVTGADTFFGESGTITLTVGDNGVVTIQFTATAKNGAGSSSSITNGKVENLVILPPVAPQCTLSTYSEFQDDESTSGRFAYDSKGRLIQFVANGLMYNYFWSNLQVTRVLAYNDDKTIEETWTYGNVGVTTVTGKITDEEGTNPFTIAYTYSGTKLSSAIRRETTDDGVLTYQNNITWSQDNVSIINYHGPDDFSQTMTHSQYDDKKNFWQLIADATRNPVPLGFLESLSGEFLGKNNVGKIVKAYDGDNSTEIFTYTYNTSGYPITFNFVKDGGTEYEYVHTGSMTYIGCPN